MVSSKETVTKFTLELTQEESDWLREVMANPLCDEGFEETEKDQLMRSAFWNALIR